MHVTGSTAAQPTFAIDDSFPTSGPDFKDPGPPAAVDGFDPVAENDNAALFDAKKPGGRGNTMQITVDCPDGTTPTAQATPNNGMTILCVDKPKPEDSAPGEPPSTKPPQGPSTPPPQNPNPPTVGPSGAPILD